MQQTEKYQLNLIETSDTFSPDPLNENMEKVEAALNTKSDAAAVEERLAALEIHKIVVGSYGGGVTQTIELGCTPQLVVLQRKGGYMGCIGVICDGETAYGEIIENGFIVTGGKLSAERASYIYAAFI